MTPEIIICDDDPQMVDLLVNFCESKLKLHILDKATKGQAVIDMVKKSNPDILLLDINLPDMDGIQVARQIREFNPFVKIIFITGHENYYRDAFDVYAYDYISKDSLTTRLPQSVKRIKEEMKLNRIKENGSNWHQITVNKKQHYINEDDIIYIKSEGRKLVIVTYEEEYVTYGNLKDWGLKLGSTFFKCHRSYLINLNKIKEIRGGIPETVVIMGNRQKIPVSRFRVSELKRVLNMAG
ncbi:LytR/AlgR family response regulator transcription factor [Halothermothrix orenii]|uniref:Stage 0 sporulation protein A homolog n=1 Tax=Halothermothrix orenii (strain H 168 / OCM 544 / DSM 9562) TaxID=373903 RepID=B8D0V7_HALOH|nr:LytTR family DNA-binding domain-containing protein [Halothermothrix orenii]ACL68926.1 two component transcriptional regulator, LytTR family [Halothermothrix orenii H 168]